MNLSNLEKKLKTHVIGQDEAVKKVCKVLRRSDANVRILTRPVASFLFAGPPGVGKTKLANALAAMELYWSSDYSLIRFDMGDYNRKQFISQLAESITLNPRPVILLHRIENASSDVGDALLRIMSEGTLTNCKGERLDFNSAIIVMTSNCVLTKLCWSSFTQAEVRQRISLHLRGVFVMADIWNRVDDVVLFDALKRRDVEHMVEVMVGEFRTMNGICNFEVEVSDGMKNRVVDEGYHPSRGAEPLNSAFARLVENTLADGIADGSIERRCGGVGTLEYHNGPYVYQK